jgi:peroxiredoxin
MKRLNYRVVSAHRSALAFGIALAAVLLWLPQKATAGAQQQQIVWNNQEQPIVDKLKTLRKLSHDERAQTTKELALQIRQLPAGINKVRLANALASRATEGDFGRDTLQEVTTTLAQALREHPLPGTPKGPPMEYVELAQLVRYEHMQGALDDPQYTAAVARLDADDARHQQASFTLTDLQGKTWTLSDLRGKVVLVNFWATWCPPCRSEMPDLEALYNQYKDRGFVVLAISDEDADKVKKYIDENHYTYTILLDSGQKVNEQYNIEGIPKSFVYNREGKLVAQSIDMRTKAQFLAMLTQAGLQ